MAVIELHPEDVHNPPPPRTPHHPAGHVTAFDEESGLPIVRRHHAPEGQSHAQEAVHDAPKPLQDATAAATNAPQPVGDKEPRTGRDIVQSTDNPAELHAAAKGQAPWLKEQAEKIIQGINGAKVEGVRDQKAPADLGEKLNKEGQPAETIPDYLGARIVVDSPQARDEVAKRVRNMLDVVKETDDFEKGSQPYGFRTHTFQVKTPDGNSAELQVVPKEIADINDATHARYEAGEKARIAGSDGEHKRIAADVKAQHDHAMSDFNKRNASNGSGKDEADPKYKFGNTQHNIAPDSEAGKALDATRAKVKDTDLAGDGKDIGDNHVTVRYGIQGADTTGIRKFIEQQGPFDATLGPIGHFPPSEHSDGAAPLVAHVHSPELHRIHHEIAKHGDFTEPNFADYKPHATVAYVKPEAAKKYAGDKSTEGKKFRVDRIAITDRNGNSTHVALNGSASKDAWTKGDRVKMKDGRSGTVQYYDGQITKRARVRTDDGETVQSVHGRDLEKHEPGVIAVDLDGTLAKYNGWQGSQHIGPPIHKMIDRVKRWLANGEQVIIFTARVDGDKDEEGRRAIEEWCQKHIGQVLPITNKKPKNAKVFYDDRAVQVQRNSGDIIASHRRATAQ